MLALALILAGLSVAAIALAAGALLAWREAVNELLAVNVRAAEATKRADSADRSASEAIKLRNLAADELAKAAHANDVLLGEIDAHFQGLSRAGSLSSVTDAVRKMLARPLSDDDSSGPDGSSNTTVRTAKSTESDRNPSGAK